MITKIKHWIQVFNTFQNPLTYWLLWKGWVKSAQLLLKTKNNAAPVTLNSTEILSTTVRLSLFYLIEIFNRKNCCNIIYNRKENTIQVSKDSFLIKIKWDWKCLPGLVEAVEKKIPVVFNGNNYVANLAENIQIIVREGNVLQSDIGVIDEVWKQKIYSPPISLPQQGAIIDIGGYLGESAIWFSNQFGLSVHVYEPHLEMFEVLKKNMALNNERCKGKIFFYNEAVSDKNEQIIIEEDNFGPWAGFGLLNHISLKNDKKGREINVKTINLNTIFNRSQEEICLVKSDCEGAEFLAFLNSGADLLRKSAQYIIEYHGEPELLANHFKSCGFKIKILPPKVHLMNLSIGLMYALREN